VNGDLTMMAGDLTGLAMASVLALALLVMPGALVAKGLHRIAPETRWRAFSPALAIAFLPLVDSLAIRFSGVPLALGLRLLMLAATLFWARDFVPRIGRVAAAGALAWWLFLACLYVDIDFGEALHQPITVLDLVKHAAVVRELSLRGVPLHDPFFARTQAAGYYHYFYDGAAILDVASSRFVDARMAFVGAAFAVGLVMASFVRALVVELGWQRSSDRRLTALVIFACAIGGLDLIGIVARWGATGLLEANSEWWDDEISFVPTAASWVPHHLSAVVASVIALMLLTKAVAVDRKRGAALAALAAIAMANAFGLSIWVALGAAGVFAAALRVIPGELRLAWLAAMALAGCLALVLSVPQLADLLHGRAGGGVPIWPWIREPGRIGEMLGSPAPPLLSLALTPLAWLLEFGPFAVGTWLFYRGNWERGFLLARLLTASFVAGLLMNLLLRSTIINNDFGWRVAWFAQLPAMIWTVAVLQQPIAHIAWRWTMRVAIALGLAATLYNAVAARMVRPPFADHAFGYINSDPPTDYALAQAYRWAARHIPASEVLQHNPLTARRVFDFGLYGVHAVAVADSEATLFGAPPEAVVAQMRTYGDIFAGRLDPAHAGKVHLVVTWRDPLWSRLSPRDCLYRSPHVCITRGETS
jgi:hypothetical protein